jgi:hypothetical protein
MSPSSLRQPQCRSEFRGCHAVTTVSFSECVRISCCTCNLRLQYIQALLFTCTLSKVHASEAGDKPHPIRRLGFRILCSIPSLRLEDRLSAILQHKPRHIHIFFLFSLSSISINSSTITKSAVFAPKSCRILIRPAAMLQVPSRSCFLSDFNASASIQVPFFYQEPILSNAIEGAVFAGDC